MGAHLGLVVACPVLRCLELVDIKVANRPTDNLQCVFGQHGGKVGMV